MSLRMTEEEYAEFQRRRGDANGGVNYALASMQAVRRTKYNNRKTEIDGKKFDSRHEAECYLQLMARVAAGELRCVCRQVKFDLPGGIVYVADFVAYTPDLRLEGVYDAKSEITAQNRVYINKRKQMKAIYGIEIREV